VRRRGIARRILAELETLARAMGYTRLQLETGTLQPEAMRLYERNGYERIPPFGHYADDPRTVCYGKQIARCASPRRAVKTPAHTNAVRETHR
jgi:ribosomal protein S18 acetylase RimI-like enzyme